MAADFGRIVTDLADPVMEGRGAGLGGLDRARDALVYWFRGLGIDGAFVDDRGRAQFTQPLEIDLGARAVTQRLGFTSPDGDDGQFVDLESGRGGAFNALGFSANATFEAEAVFVGYGIVWPQRDYDSYAGLGAEGLQGKVAIAYRYEPVGPDGHSQWAVTETAAGRWSDAAALTRKARWAADHGAAALMVVDPPSKDGHSLRSTRGTAFGETARIPVFHLRSSVLTRILNAAGRDAQAALRAYESRANRGVDRPEALTGVQIHGQVMIERPKAIIHNVGAVLPGAGRLGEELVIVGAHYDHLGFGDIGSFSSDPVVHPGADDNASGTAAVMLLAQRMSRLAQDSVAADRRAVLFVCFSGEERGLIGSSYLVNHPEQLTVELNQAVAMINFDMVGRLRGDEIFVLGTGSGDRWDQLFDHAASNLGLKLKRESSAMGASDHISFYLKQIPAVHLFTGVHEDYHRPTDTADKVNTDGGSLVVELAGRVLERLATGPQRMAFVEVEGTDQAVHGGAMQGSDARLGILPDYSTQEGSGGCGVVQVFPDTAAARGGLKGGDVIMKWNGEPVPNVRSLTALLAAAHPDQKVELTVRRGAKTLRLGVELGRR